MKARVPDLLEKGRAIAGDPAYQTARGDWYGRFVVCGPRGDYLLLVVSKGDPEEWADCGFDPPAFEHVSVSVRYGLKAGERCPVWEEMAWVKDLCWDADECVIQYHPAKADYVNFQPLCLHLWKPVGVELPRPPRLAVGPVARAELSS